MQGDKTPMPLSTGELVGSLDGLLKALGPSMGWDSPKAWSEPKERGLILVRFLGHQGNLAVRVDIAEDYLKWLQAGGRSTIIKWAKDNGRKLR